MCLTKEPVRYPGSLGAGLRSSWTRRSRTLRKSPTQPCCFATLIPATSGGLRGEQADAVAQTDRIGALSGRPSTKSEDGSNCAPHRGNGVGGVGGSGQARSFSTCTGLMRTREPSAASVSDMSPEDLRSTCACTTLMSSVTVMSPETKVRTVAIGRKSSRLAGDPLTFANIYSSCIGGSGVAS
jgi:hypothetical protein